MIDIEIEDERWSQAVPDAEAMEALEREILSGLGVPDPYAATGQGDHG